MVFPCLAFFLIFTLSPKAVEKSKYLQTLQRYSSTSIDEAQEIAALRAQFPYSQLLQTLAARTSKDHGLQHQQRDLQIAAVYAADRANLKELIIQPEEPVLQVVSKHVDAQLQAENTIDSVDMADVVMDDLERLSRLKGTFENLFMEYPKSAKTVKEVTLVPDEVQKTIAHEQPVAANLMAQGEAEAQPTQETQARQEAKSKKERIIEMARALNTTDGMIYRKKRNRDKDGNPVDELITEIQNSKEEIVPENERQKQQIEIINQFIRVQPSISNPKDRVPSAIADLNPVKSGEFGDNIVSETLVEILVKQGKKDKAIEVLKKLIWKYPQKKAYFASQIEDLKK